jgi:hypothetical protein
VIHGERNLPISETSKNVRVSRLNGLKNLPGANAGSANNCSQSRLGVFSQHVIQRSEAQQADAEVSASRGPSAS